MATKLESLSTKLQSALDLANSLPDAITLDELTNPGSAATMLEGTEMLDAQGKKVTGSIETKDSSNLTASGATVNVPAGYYADDAMIEIETTEMAPLYASVSTNGVLTARVSVLDDGYIEADTQTYTQQLDTQSATTITPTKSSQTAVEAGKYTTGAVTVGAIPDEYQDVSGVTATAARTAAGDVFVDADGVEQTGTLNVDEIVYNDDAGDKVYIKTNGIASNRLSVPVKPVAVTPSKSSQHITPPDGNLIRSVSVAPIPDEFADVSGVTATTARVASGDKFVDADGVEQTGTLNVNKAFLLDSGDFAHAITGGYVATTSSGDHALTFYGDVFGNASKSDVLEGYTFTAAAGVKLPGTMPNNGSVATTIDGLETKSATIPAGYTTGGTVALDSTIDTTASTQAAQIAEIKALLEGKSVSGGGSGAVETCTVKITGSLNIYSAGATVYKDGAISDYIEGRLYAQDITELTIENVVCNSVVSFYGVGGSIPAASGENAEVTLSSGNFYVKVTAPSGGTSTITTYDAD